MLKYSYINEWSWISQDAQWTITYDGSMYQPWATPAMYDAPLGEPLPSMYLAKRRIERVKLAIEGQSPYVGRPSYEELEEKLKNQRQFIKDAQDYVLSKAIEEATNADR